MIEIQIMLFMVLAVSGITLFKLIEYVTQLQYKIERLEKIVIALDPRKEAHKLNMREQNKGAQKGQLIPFLADIKKRNTITKKPSGDDDNGQGA